MAPSACCLAIDESQDTSFSCDNGDYLAATKFIALRALGDGNHIRSSVIDEKLGVLFKTGNLVENLVDPRAYFLDHRPNIFDLSAQARQQVPKLLCASRGCRLELSHVIHACEAPSYLLKRVQPRTKRDRWSGKAIQPRYDILVRPGQRFGEDHEIGLVLLVELGTLVTTLTCQFAQKYDGDANLEFGCAHAKSGKVEGVHER